MMNLRQVKSPRSGYSRFAAALLLPGLLLAAGLFARENGRLAAALPPATASVLADTTNIEATICTGLTYAFGDDELKVSGTYTQTFTATDGSDSTVVLDLTVLPAPVTELHAGICEGDSYPFFGLNLTTTGTYTQTLSTPEGCDSIVELSLRVVPFFDIQESATICAGDTVYFGGGALTGSGIYVDSLVATGGCDSVRTLVLTVLPSPQTHWHAGICEGTSLEFNGDTLDQSGTYTYIYPAENGCDSTVTLHLTVASYFETELEATICAGESYSFGGIDLTESGVYTDSLQAAGGCDSTLILTLTVLPPTPTTFAEATICDNQTITLGDQELSEPGTYTVALTGPNGCDSTVVLTLTVLPTSTTNLSVSICSNESYEIGGASLNESGAYTFVFPAENGCDSTVVLDLTVLPVQEIVTEATICFGASYAFEGETFDASGNYSVVYTGENGCDSTMTLVLEVLPELLTELEITICAGESYEFDGAMLTEAGHYSAVFTGSSGCDSTVHLNLLVAPVQETALEATVCAGENYNFNGETLEASGVYTALLQTELGCDSTVTLTLTVLDPTPPTTLSATICSNEIYIFNGLALDETGLYSVTLADANGCDSLVLLQLQVLPVAASELEIAICAGESVEFNGQTLTESGSYTETLVGENGCDSLATLHLTVLPVYNIELNRSICANESYDFNGQTLNETGTYTAQLMSSAGCDSTVVLQLEVFPLDETNISATICNGESYAFNGLNLSASGVYAAVLSNANNCDSTIILTLEVLPAPVTNIQATICSNESYDFNGEPLNTSGVYAQEFVAENGCDSTVVLQLTVLPIADVTVSVQICEGSSYPFDGQDLVNSGTYFAQLTTAAGCDSLVTLELAVLDTLVTTLTASICAGEAYLFNNELLTETGNYEAFYTASGNCDSLVILYLTVLETSATELEASICAGSSYDFNGETLAETGVYTAVLQNNLGCDSTVTLTLTVLETNDTEIEAAICAGSAYDFNGETLTETGVYTAVLSNNVGCDSTVTLTLTVLETNATDIEAAICAGSAYDFNGETLTETGVYSAVLTNAVGCDSTVTLTLTVLPASETRIEASVCEGDVYEFQGEPLNQAGTYTAALTGASGCDSLVVLQLAVLPTNTTTILAEICPGASFEFNGAFLTDPGVYTAVETGANGCDSTTVLVLSILEINTEVSLQGNTLTAQATNVQYQWINCATNQLVPGATASTFTPAVTGNYAVVITTPNGCTAVSACTQVTIVGTHSPLLDLSWNLQPNPAGSNSSLRLSAPASAAYWVELFDQTGRLVQRQQLPEGAQRLPLDLTGLPQGLYGVRLNDGRSLSAMQRLVKTTD